MAVDISMIKVHLRSEFKQLLCTELMCTSIDVLSHKRQQLHLHFIWTVQYEINKKFIILFNFEKDISMKHVDFKEWKIIFLLRSFKTTRYN